MIFFSQQQWLWVLFIYEFSAFIILGKIQTILLLKIKIYCFQVSKFKDKHCLLIKLNILTNIFSISYSIILLYKGTLRFKMYAKWLWCILLRYMGHTNYTYLLASQLHKQLLERYRLLSIFYILCSEIHHSCN